MKTKIKLMKSIVSILKSDSDLIIEKGNNMFVLIADDEKDMLKIHLSGHGNRILVPSFREALITIFTETEQ